MILLTSVAISSAGNDFIDKCSYGNDFHGVKIKCRLKLNLSLPMRNVLTTLFSCYCVFIKWRKKYHIVRIIPKSNRKILEKEAKLLTLTLVYTGKHQLKVVGLS